MFQKMAIKIKNNEIRKEGQDRRILCSFFPSTVTAKLRNPEPNYGKLKDLDPIFKILLKAHRIN
jgi:hypothetical protein